MSREDDRREDNARLAREEGARVQRELTERIQATELAGLRAASEVRRLDGDIQQHRAGAAAVAAARDRMDRAHASLVADLGRADHSRARDWSGRLARIDLTGRSAGAELDELYEDIDRAHRQETYVADGMPTPKVPDVGRLLGFPPGRLDPPPAPEPAPDPRREQMIADARLRASTLRLLRTTLDYLRTSCRHWQLLTGARPGNR